MMRCAVESLVLMVDNAEARAFLQRRFRPAGPACPACGVSVVGVRAKTWRNGGRLHCACGKWFDWRTGTPICGVSADERQLVVLLALLQARAQTSFISAATRLPAATIRNYRLKFSEASCR